MILVVLFCVQHAAVANCEQTVGDNITLLNVPFSFNNCSMEQKKAFHTPFHGMKIGLICTSFYGAQQKKLKHKPFQLFQNYR